jgi:hypothetical protein
MESGLLKVAEAALKDSPIIQAVTSVTKLNDTNTIQFKNMVIPIEINNGVLDVKPFDVKLWDYQANIQGSTGFDGTINYLVNMQVPAGQFGAQANSVLSAISGTEATESTIIPLALSLGGTYNAPKVGLAGGNSIENLLTNALKSRVGAEKENIQQEVTKQFQAAEDSLKNELKLKAKWYRTVYKKEADKKVEETKEKAVDEAKNVLKGLLKPKPAKPDTTRIN